MQSKGFASQRKYVEDANALADFCGSVLCAAVKLGKAASFENPLNSFLFDFVVMLRSLNLPEVGDFDYIACSLGGAREEAACSC